MDRIFDRYFSEEDARQAPQHTSLVPAPGSQGGFCSFKLSLGYIIKPCLKRKRRKGEGEEGREGGGEKEEGEPSAFNAYRGRINSINIIKSIFHHFFIFTPTSLY